MAFMLKPGIYTKNAKSIDIYNSDSLLFSGNMNTICNNISEKIEYYDWLKHNLWIIWNGGNIIIDNNDNIIDNNDIIVKQKNKGFHTISLKTNNCNNPKLLNGGRFIEAWIVNFNKNNIYKFNPQILYNGNYISTY